MKKSKYRANSLFFLAVAAVSLAFVLGILNICFGNLNLDEGWYLLAARNVAGGMRPYRDFFFTQAPLMPSVYGWLEPLWGGHGILGARILTFALGYSASLLSSLAAARAAGNGRRIAAGLTVFLLLQCNVVHSYFTVIPKTYALASLFTACGCVALVFALTSTRGAKRWAAFFAGLSLALAASTRLSLGVMLPVAGIALLVLSQRHPGLWFSFGIGGATGLAWALIPAVFADCEAFAFANFFHGGRSGGGISMALGSVSRLVRNYQPLALLAMAACFMACRRRGNTVESDCGADSPASRLHTLEIPAILLLMFAAAFAVHVSAPFPYDDYQTPIMPLAAVAISLLFWSWLRECAQTRILVAMTLVAAMCAFSSPLNESWFVLRKDRFWVEKKQCSDLQKLRATARELSSIVHQDDVLLTQDGYLAVELKCAVPPGFEMGPFGYFAELPDAEARRYHVLNRNLAAEAIESGEYQVAALSGYAFAMSAPELEKRDEERAAIASALKANYNLYCTISDFGQEHTPLEIWKCCRK